MRKKKKKEEKNILEEKEEENSLEEPEVQEKVQGTTPGEWVAILRDEGEYRYRMMVLKATQNELLKDQNENLKKIGLALNRVGQAIENQVLEEEEGEE